MYIDNPFSSLNWQIHLRRKMFGSTQINVETHMEAIFQNLKHKEQESRINK